MPLDPDHLQIVTYPHPSLRTKAKPLAGVSDQLRAVAQRMLQLMHDVRGVGLAAPQVGLPWRLFVANPTGEPHDDHIYVNPVLSDPSRETAPAEEGCLSIPDVRGQIMRPIAITLDALNEHGEKIHDRSDALPARIWQHETDHLDAILILDKMPPNDLRANKRAIEELENK